MGVTAGTGSPEASAPAALAAEAKRVYDICAGCRRCYNLCPSFTYLLDTADEQHDGDGAALTPAEDRRVGDLCFCCSLCYPHCPYTPPHRWAVDFPRLMQDARIARAAGEGVRLRDRILGNPELLGRLGSALPRLANWANRNRWLRWGMEKVLGIDRRRRLPRYARRAAQPVRARRARRAGLRRGRPVAELQPHAEAGLPAPGARRGDGARRGPRVRPRRVPDAARRRGEARARVPGHARQGRLPGAVPSPRAGDRLQVARPVAARAGDGGRADRALHGHGRDLGIQARVLRRVVPGGAAAPARPGAGRTRSPRLRLPARGPPDRAGARAARVSSRRGVARRLRGADPPALTPMRPIGLEDVLGRERYGAERDAIRRRIIAHKRTRRVAVGDRLSFLFEDQATIWYQTQEMLWIEHITDLDAIREELASTTRSS